MQTKERVRPTHAVPGTWSSDDYIRRWARGHGLARGECIVPLQSVHDEWIARIDFEREGEPIERVVARRPRTF